MGAPDLIAPSTASGTAPVGGTGTTNTIPRWTGPSTLGDSLLIQTSNAITMTSTVNARLDFGVRNLSNGGSAYSQLFAGNDTDVLAGLLRNSSGNAGYAGPNSLNLWTVGAYPIGFVTANQLRAIVDASGNVGIGTTSPAGKLDIADAASASVYISRPGLSAVYGAAGLGNLRWRDTANAFDAAQISAVGYFPGSNGQMTFSTAAGGTMIERMRIATNASQAASQVAIGTSSFTSGRALTTVADLDVFGVRVGRGPGDIASNTAIGAGALSFCSTGSENTALGQNAGFGISTGVRNVMIGAATGSGGTVTGSRNIVVGRQAGNQLTSGSDNVLLGTQAGDSITTGSSNIVIGCGAGADVAAAGDSNQFVLGDATNYVATNGGATTYYATAGASLGYMRVRLNGTYVKIEVFADV